MPIGNNIGNGGGGGGANVAEVLNYRDVYDASSNQYPSTGGSGTGGIILKADTWIVSVEGILNSEPVKVGDMIIAKIDNPGQNPANWNILIVSIYNNSVSNSLLALMDAFTVKMNNTNTSANPQDVPINTAFNQSFETNTANIKMDGLVSVGTSNNIARSDHVHPNDTSKQNFISGANADNIVSTNNLGQVIDSGKAFSTDISLSSNSNNKIPTEQVIKYNVDYLNNKINNLPVGAGQGNLYFLTNDINDAYLTLSITPKNGISDVLTATVNNNSVLLGSFATANVLNRTIINAGVWEFNLWCFAESIQATTNIYAEVYKLNLTNVETLLFTLNNNNNIGSTNVIYYSISGTQPAYTILPTDKLLVKFYAKTTRAQNILVTMYYNSTQYYSHMHTPFVIAHNQLAELNGGDGNNQYYHLTQTQYNNVINQASISQTGYLSSTDFITFNNKQNLLTNPVTSSSATPTANQLSVFNANGTQVTPTTRLPTSAIPIFTGEVTSTGGSLSLTIANNVVTNAKQSQATSYTWKGNNTNVTANISDNATGSLTEIGSSIFTIFGANSTLNNATIKANLSNANIYVGNANNVPTSVTMSGDGTIDNIGKITITKTNNVTFSSSATIDTTNANNITSGTLPNARLVSIPNSSLANSNITIAGNSTALGGTITQDQITGLSATGLVKRTLANTLGIATVNDLPFIFNNIYYVSPNGNNSNDGKTLATPVLTLAQALNLAGNSGVQIVILPGTYVENTTITAQNISIVAPNGEQSGICNFTGILTVNNLASSIRFIGLNINTFIHTGIGSVYLYNSSTTSLSKTGSGYLQISSCNSQGSSSNGTVSITGSGSVVCDERSLIGNVTINNALAQVTFANNNNSLPINILAGLIGINDTPVYTLSRVTPAITIATGASCYISKSTMILPAASIGTATVTIATPTVITIANHNLSNGQKIYFITTGALPTGITANTTYWVTVVNINTFNISTTYTNYITGIFVATSGTQSGTHTVSLTADNLAKITANAGSFYSLDNVLFDKPNSTLSGTVLTRTGYSDSIELTTALPITSGGTGSGIRQTAINNLAGAVTNAQFLRGNGTNVTMSAIQVSDVPTLNQNTTGTSASVTGTNVITNTNLEQMPTNTIKGNNTGVTANANDLTATQVTAILNNFVGDSGSGGTKGLVPSPVAGDAIAGKYLKSDGTWAIPAGGTGGTISQYFHAKPAAGVNTWDANRRMQFSQVLTSLGSNITLANTGIVRLNSAGTYKLTAVWQGTQSAGGATIQWYNETNVGFAGQSTVISPSDSPSTTSTNSVLIYTVTITSATNFSIRSTASDNLQPNAVSSYVIVEQINNVTSDGTVSSPIYISSRDASSNNVNALQTISNSTGSSAWNTAAPTANKININGNLIISNANAFTVDTNNITILQAGAYLIQFNIDGANTTGAGSNVQIYTQLVQNGTVIAVNQDQPGNVNNYTNNVINVIINCNANDVIDFRINTGSGTSNIGINSYNLNIIKQGNISQPANNVTSALVANNGTLTVDNLIVTATSDSGKGFLISTTSGTISSSINAYAVLGTNYLSGTFHTENYNITTTASNPWGWTSMNQNNNEAVIRLRNNTNNKYYEIKVQLSTTTHIIAIQTLI